MDLIDQEIGWPDAWCIELYAACCSEPNDELYMSTSSFGRHMQFRLIVMNCLQSGAVMSALVMHIRM